MEGHDDQHGEGPQAVEGGEPATLEGGDDRTPLSSLVTVHALPLVRRSASPARPAHWRGGHPAITGAGPAGRPATGHPGEGIAPSASGGTGQTGPVTGDHGPFDEWVVVDWSASSRPSTGADSVWIAHATAARAPSVDTVNPPTRARAVDHVEALVAEATTRGRTVLVGWDFSFGYPASFARRLVGRPVVTGDRPWRRTWRRLAELSRDGADNANNRFDVADLINRQSGVRFFWGRPQHPRFDHLAALPPRDQVPDRLSPNPCRRLRVTEEHAGPGIRSGWQLYGAGSVGGQVLTGLPWLERLLGVLGDAVAVWPFETGFGPRPLDRPDRARAVRDGRPLRPTVLLAEMWPPAFTRGRALTGVRDEAQVRATAEAVAGLTAGEWAHWLRPATVAELGPAARRRVLEEEGWILGVP